MNILVSMVSGSYGSSDAGGMYSSSYSEYMSRGNNVMLYLSMIDV